MLHLPSTYKMAVLINGVVNIITQRFPQQALGEDTVVIRPDYMGVCRADIKEIAGSRDIPTDRGPLFGHEFVGAVVFAGTGSGFHQGELVTFNPNITPNRTTGFADYVFVHGSAEQLDQAIVRVPEPDILGNIWMPEPFACIVHAIRKLLELARWPHLDGKRVGIIGAGCSGIMFSWYTKHLGATVVAFNRSEMRRNFVLERGLMTEKEVCSFSAQEHHRDAFDVVIVVPTRVTSSMLEMAADIAVEGGILHLYGGTREGDRFLSTPVDIDAVRRSEHIEPVEYQGKTLMISGAYGCFKEDYEESFRLHAEHPDDFPLEKIVSQEIDFDEFPALMMSVAAGTIDLPGKVVVRPSAETRSGSAVPQLHVVTG